MLEGCTPGPGPEENVDATGMGVISPSVSQATWSRSPGTITALLHRPWRRVRSWSQIHLIKPSVVSLPCLVSLGVLFRAAAPDQEIRALMARLRLGEGEGGSSPG